ncbi:MAG: helix-turn-helix domain-containing protein [Chlamydiae bacterium]|nr:helix-turn-helix domain-containing protein [Chlamydiota bacterium]
MKIKDYLTVTQVSDLVGISRQAVLKAIDKRRIKAEVFNAGKHSFYLIPRKELKKFK